MASFILAHAHTGVRRVDEDTLQLELGFDEANELIRRLETERHIVLSSDPVYILTTDQDGAENRDIGHFIAGAAEQLAKMPPKDTPPDPPQEDPGAQRGYGTRLARETEEIERLVSEAQRGGRQLFIVEAEYTVTHRMHHHIFATSEEEARAIVEARQDGGPMHQDLGDALKIGMKPEMLLMQLAHAIRQHGTMREAGWTIQTNRAQPEGEEALRKLIRWAVRRRMAEGPEAIRDLSMAALMAHFGLED